jgi:hypothetical protein
MTEQENKDYAACSARHLANLLGREVAGYLPDYAKDGKPHTIDIDVELLENSVGVASLVILSALIKNKQRDHIIQNINSNFLNSFDRYLYELILEQLISGDEVDYSKIKDRIPEYGPKYYGEPSDERSLRGYYFTWAQILDLDPTPAQIDRAFELLRKWAKKGLNSTCDN